MIAIRFDGPPGAVSGRFIEVERDGASIQFGEWKQDGDDWLLELKEVEQLEAAVESAKDLVNEFDNYGFIDGQTEIWSNFIQSLANLRERQDNPDKLEEKGAT